MQGYFDGVSFVLQFLTKAIFKIQRVTQCTMKSEHNADL